MIVDGDGLRCDAQRNAAEGSEAEEHQGPSAGSRQPHQFGGAVRGLGAQRGSLSLNPTEGSREQRHRDDESHPDPYTGDQAKPDQDGHVGKHQRCEADR